MVAYQLADVVELGSGVCISDYRLADGAVAKGSAIVGSDGIYRMTLPAGDYALTATDPIDGCRVLSGTAHINDDTPITWVHFHFNHGAY